MQKPTLFSNTLFLFLLLCVTSSGATAPASGPLEMVRSASDAILGRVIADKALIEKDSGHVVGLINDILIPRIDDETIARRVLGPAWDTASPAQRTAFTLQFRRYMVRFYAQVFVLYSGEKVEYSAMETASQPDVRKVTSSISRSGEAPIQAAYRVELREGAWRVTDIIVDGVSLVQTNQSQFKHMIARDGLDKVIAMLETRNDRPLR